MTDRPIFYVIEFHGDGDPMFGGAAADWGLYRQEDGSAAFIAGHTAFSRKLAKAYYPTKEEAEMAGGEASVRKGLISALEAKIDPRIPTTEISWFVQRLHVGTPDEEVAEVVASRLGECDDSDVIAQACAYALACHRVNQELVTAFRL